MKLFPRKKNSSKAKQTEFQNPPSDIRAPLPRNPPDAANGGFAEKVLHLMQKIFGTRNMESAPGSAETGTDMPSPAFMRDRFVPASAPVKKTDSRTNPPVSGNENPEAGDGIFRFAESPEEQPEQDRDFPLPDPFPPAPEKKNRGPRIPLWSFRETEMEAEAGKFFSPGMENELERSGFAGEGKAEQPFPEKILQKILDEISAERSLLDGLSSETAEIRKEMTI